MNVYGTSKIYLIMASKALNEKLKGTGVEIFAAHPGTTPCNAHGDCGDEETSPVLALPTHYRAQLSGWQGIQGLHQLIDETLDWITRFSFSAD